MMPSNVNRHASSHATAIVERPVHLMRLPTAGREGGWPAGMPVPATPLFGREREVGAIRDLLCDGQRRLVTLTGPGGVGKTRLALRVAASLTDEFADGPAFVSLVDVTDPALFPRAVALALGIAAERDAAAEPSWLMGLVGALRDRQVLLVLDNLEHLVAVAPVLAQLLASCPGLRTLATSRVPLRLSEEQEFPVAPLALPGERREDGKTGRRKDEPDLPVYPSTRLPVSLADSPAVGLFVERARAVQPSFEVTEANQETIVEICRRLDGLPLAIELAAARIAHLPLEALLNCSAYQLPILTGGPRDAPARHRTMRDAIGWSVDLLDDEDRRVFARLGVFSGGFTLDAAEAVQGERGRDGEGERTKEFVSPSVLDSIRVLVEASLVRLLPGRDGQGGPRYGMLETIREYAWEALVASGEADATAAKLAGWLAELNERAAFEIRGPDQATWLARLDAERANFRAMTSWALAREDAETALRLTTKAAWFYWETRGLLREESQLLERALEIAERTPEGIDPRLLGRGLMAQGMRYATAGEYEAAYRKLEHAIRILEEAGDREAASSAQGNFASVLTARGDLERAREVYEQAVAYRRTTNDPRRTATLLINGASHMTFAGDLVAARARLDEVAPMIAAIGEPRDTAYFIYFQGELALYLGRLNEAEAKLTEARERLLAIPDYSGAVLAAMHLGLLRTFLGETAAAAELVREALDRVRKLGSKPLVPCILDVFAGLLLEDGRAAAAARMLGAGTGLRAVMGAALRPIDQLRRDEVTRRVWMALGDDGFDAAEQAGSAMPFGTLLDEAIALAAEVAGAGPAALRLVGSAAGGATTGPRALFGAGALTERERGVLSLLVEGLSDREIADRLCISARTASSHVGRILAKLDVATRTAATALAIREGLA